MMAGLIEKLSEPKPRAGDTDQRACAEQRASPATHADILGWDIRVPRIPPHVTAVSAAIHGAVATCVVADFAEGSCWWSAKDCLHYRTRPEATVPYRTLYEQYRELSQNTAVRISVHRLNDVQ